MKKITIVFYEYPAALHDIGLWEITKEKEIKFKEVKDNNIMFYLENECVICTTIQEPNFKLLQEYLNNQNLYYYKTLIFGKVTALYLNKLIIFISKCEENIKLNVNHTI